jgi:hypothetical protein
LRLDRILAQLAWSFLRWSMMMTTTRIPIYGGRYAACLIFVSIHVVSSCAVCEPIAAKRIILQTKGAAVHLASVGFEIFSTT